MGAGAGCVLIQTFSFAAKDAIARGELLPVLTAWQPDPYPFFLLYPPDRHMSQRLRVFIEWATERLHTSSIGQRSRRRVPGHSGWAVIGRNLDHRLQALARIAPFLFHVKCGAVGHRQRPGQHLLAREHRPLVGKYRRYGCSPWALAGRGSTGRLITWTGSPSLSTATPSRTTECPIQPTAGIGRAGPAPRSCAPSGTADGSARADAMPS